jgi:type IV pilus biogenesis protein CpaD/CtpE
MLGNTKFNHLMGLVQNPQGLVMKNLQLINAPAGAIKMVCAVSLLALLVGCASTPAPDTQMAVAEAAVQTANTSNTSEHAPRELQIAISKLASARQAYERKDYIEARKLAQQAELDAQVALTRAQSVSATKAAQESGEAARVLREEINRKTTY